MDNSKESLLNDIREAFGRVSFPSHMGIRAAMAVDNWVSSKEELIRITSEEDIIADWWNIPYEELDECVLGLSYLDSDGIEFYLPAYMCRMIVQPEQSKYPILLSILDPNPIWNEAQLRDLYETRFRKIDRAKKSVCRLFMEDLKSTYLDNRKDISNQVDQILVHPFWSI